jgi:UDP-N-acetylglucosamine--N-acetylmuramyl-(pentapeptide) pyrophosphoryl-undecaprenol N-acetylglucosamine transferase
LICAGGTGGGVYPALAVHSALKAAHPDFETLWVGGEGGMEADLVQRAGVDFRTIPAAGLHGVDLRQYPSNLAAIWRGIQAAASILNEFEPDVLFFTGGFVAVPMAFAGRKIPSLLFVPDIEPGMALKALAAFAKRITVTSEESRQYFSNRADVVVTGYPVRADLIAWDKRASRLHLDIRGDLPVVLVFGGSKGARSINQALLENLTGLLERVEVVHISGELDWPVVERARENLSIDQAQRYHAFAYLHEDMGAALSAADLVVSRAGASALGEFPQFGLPAILVPYPHAWRYQKINAENLAKNGAAIVLEDARLKSGLLMTIEKLLENPQKLVDMRSAMLARSSQDAAGKIAAQLSQLAGE